MPKRGGVSSPAALTNSIQALTKKGDQLYTKRKRKALQIIKKKLSIVYKTRTESFAEISVYMLERNRRYKSVKGILKLSQVSITRFPAAIENQIRDVNPNKHYNGTLFLLSQESCP